jgi:predicted TIM-barrel fold metal-dependent hydrolase
MIIDCHCHAGPGDALTAPWNTRAPLAAYLRRARRAGIDRTIVFAAFNSDNATANDEVARLVAAAPGRLTGFAFLDPAHDAGRIDEMLDRAVRHHGFRGIKIHGTAPTRETCEAARRFNVPVLVDVFGKPSMVDMFAPEFPEVTFIIPHLGSFADDFAAQQQVVDQLVRLPNVYADTSGVRRFDYLLQAVRRAGPRKLLFGSDGPWLHPGVELYKIRALGLAPADFELVAGGNAARLILASSVGVVRRTPGRRVRIASFGSRRERRRGSTLSLR